MAELLKEKLEKELSSELDKIGKLSPGTEDHERAIKAYKNLYDLKLSQERDFNEVETKYNIHAEDKELKEREIELKKQEIELEREKIRSEVIAQEKAEKKDKILRGFEVGIKVAGIFAPLITYNTWMKRTMVFEETGSFTSTAARNTLPKVLKGSK